MNNADIQFDADGSPRPVGLLLEINQLDFLIGSSLDREQWVRLVNLYYEPDGFLRNIIMSLLNVARAAQVEFKEQNVDGGNNLQSDHERALALCKKRNWDPKNTGLFTRAVVEILDQ